MRTDTSRRSIPSFRSRFTPPVPGEHGAIVMTAAALATPLSAVAYGGRPGVGALSAYVAFVGLAAVALLLREALQRRHRTVASADRRRLTAIAVVEALAVVALAVGLAALQDPRWIVVVGLVPAVVTDLRLRRRGWPLPFGPELSGVFAISLAVPAAGVLLEVGGPRSIGALWLFFLAFHVGSVLRVGMVLPSRSDVAARTLLTVGVVVHVGLVIAATGGWLADAVGPGAPLVFAVAALRAGWVVRLQDETVPLPALGRAEGTLSALFVLAAPLLLP